MASNSIIWSYLGYFDVLVDQKNAKWKLMEEKYYLFIFLAFVSEILGTISGFGSSILFVPIASIFFDFKHVLGITAIFHVFSNLSKLALFRHGINKELVIKIGIPAIIFVIFVAYLTTFLPTEKIECFVSIAFVFW